MKHPIVVNKETGKVYLLVGLVSASNTNHKTKLTEHFVTAIGIADPDATKNWSTEIRGDELNKYQLLE